MFIHGSWSKSWPDQCSGVASAPGESDNTCGVVSTMGTDLHIVQLIEMKVQSRRFWRVRILAFKLSYHTPNTSYQMDRWKQIRHNLVPSSFCHSFALKPTIRFIYTHTQVISCADGAKFKRVTRSSRNQFSKAKGIVLRKDLGLTNSLHQNAKGHGTWTMNNNGMTLWKQNAPL